MRCLMVNSRGVITGSGTVVEETCVLGVPSLQMRKSTERPEVYDVGSSVKFDLPKRRITPPRPSITSWRSCVVGSGSTPSATAGRPSVLRLVFTVG
jgi:hypothetical protein